MNEKLKQSILYTKDFPAPGIVFRDLNPLWENSELLHIMIDETIQLVKDLKPTKIVALEARGFIIGSALAYAMGIGLTLIRKKGKLPGQTYTAGYKNEYTFMGDIEIQANALEAGDRVVLVDDILATGKSTISCLDVLQNFSNIEILGSAYILEIIDLHGKDIIEQRGIPVLSLIKD